MAGKRTYGDRCGIARALDVVGERWALLLVRELLHGPKRFRDLQSGLPRISPDVLSQRLRDLEQSGVLRRTTLPPPAAVAVYELTERGRELEPVLIALGRWGAGTPLPDASVGMSVDAQLVSLRTLFSPERAGDLTARIALRLGGERAAVRVEGGTIAVERGSVADPDATIAGDPPAVLAVLRGRRDLADAEAAGDLTIRGDRRVAERFLTLFPLPPTIPVASG